jgi:hypothetical protein
MNWSAEFHLYSGVCELVLVMIKEYTNRFVQFLEEGI